ncbi:potassium channel family protein [Streptococcus cuniculipharyngis]|uniref:Two pore domain potassium channel family protein n=1 Tax=Streptococcus cuniculipharyngis TaxID=1562651 RepID=A0A5C5SD23_9STRE|nr:potassium channel family protein [Streptococcus cuniculipharyngis]TWS98674.1 two pore domain potassium channel family protein [Streptococcus cuniculipharyngis]
MLTFWLQVRRVGKTLVSILKDEESRSLLFLTLFILLIGSMFYSQVEGFTFLDAFYFSFTTLTTIGFGDLYPVTALGKIFTILYTVIGLGLMGMFLTVFINHYLNLTKKSRQSKS